MEIKKVTDTIKKIVYYSIPLIIFFVICLKGLNNSIWLDEAFSLSMIQQNFYEIIKNTAIDVHPPLYYIILY